MRYQRHRQRSMASLAREGNYFFEFWPFHAALAQKSSSEKQPESLVSIYSKLNDHNTTNKAIMRLSRLSISLIAFFWLKISGCHGRNWLYGYQGLGPILVSLADRRELIRSLLIFHCFNKKFASSLLFLVSWSTEQVEVESRDFFPETT